jgi:uncharacterized membrane protein YjjP (DUF1212 family)
MAYNITISLKDDDKAYMEEKKLSPSEMMRKAVQMHREGSIRSDEEYLKQIETLQRIIKAVQSENQSLYDEKKALQTIKGI